MKKYILIISILLLVLFCFLYPIQNPKIVNLTETFLPMSSQHFFGTDDLGRDIFSLIIIGFRRTILVILASNILSVFIGVPLGIISAYFGGIFKQIIRLIANLCMSIPSFIVALILTMLVGQSPVYIGFALGVYGIGTFVYQSEFLTEQLLEKEFILFEKLSGTSSFNILFRFILPCHSEHIMTLMASQGTSVILSYASLTFIGLGSDITTPDWGSLLFQYRFYIVEHPLLILWPTLAILLLSVTMYILFDYSKQKKSRKEIVYD
ncbi:ABC transporter permease subunit [Granulicatella sp. zg-ZJ]|uniref:ABC transporter permease n=1 Tax=Granulicatella sp. zg-ZJ TaxID=2678504 RepID=UPI0013D11365|nr:ABC transporter permease [Granulicatella sp. zg-ZJ]MBS4749620.1 ABC transporter permease [Carnobacteriaceae bacterium zg-ZUI78]NEW62408.1 ABC transporter permease subunit [Granulicatella sp. zg-ZJ]